MSLLRACVEPGCSALVRRGRCARHVLPTRWGQGNRGGHRSSAMRAQVLREEPTCRTCGQAVSVEVDHLVPVHRGGTDERSNLAGVCHRCHALKTASEAARARTARAWRA